MQKLLIYFFHFKLLVFTYVFIYIFISFFYRTFLFVYYFLYELAYLQFQNYAIPSKINLLIYFSFQFELSTLLIRTIIKDLLWKSPFLNLIVSSRRKIGLCKVFIIRYYCFFVYPFNVTTYYFCLFSN